VSLKFIPAGSAKKTEKEEVGAKAKVKDDTP
jgi:hypothetical protein